MSRHELKLAYEITGKAKGGRVEHSHVIAKKAYFEFDEVPTEDLKDAVVVQLGDYTETIKTFDGKFYIKNSVPDLSAAQLRAQAFLIPDYHLAKALTYGSTFDVQHYADPKFLQPGLPESAINLVRAYKEYKDEELRTADVQLQKAIEERLIESDGELYFEVGKPAICLRLISGNLQVFFAFKSEQDIKSSVPIIMLPVDSKGMESDDVELLMQFHEDKKGRKGKILSEARQIAPEINNFEYSARNDIVSEAKRRVVEQDAKKKMSKSQYDAWTRLNDALEPFSNDKAGGRIDELSEALQAYAHFENDDVLLYAQMLNFMLVHEPIDIGSIDLRQIPYLSID